MGEGGARGSGDARADCEVIPRESMESKDLFGTMTR